MIEGIPLAIDFRKGSMRVLRAAEDSTQPFQLPTLFDHDEVLGILRGQLGGVSRIVQVVWHMPPDHLTPQEQCWTDLDTDRLSADRGDPAILRKNGRPCNIIGRAGAPTGAARPWISRCLNSANPMP